MLSVSWFTHNLMSKAQGAILEFASSAVFVWPCFGSALSNHTQHFEYTNRWNFISMKNFYCHKQISFDGDIRLIRTKTDQLARRMHWSVCKLQKCTPRLWGEIVSKPKHRKCSSFLRLLWHCFLSFVPNIRFSSFLRFSNILWQIGGRLLYSASIEVKHTFHSIIKNRAFKVSWKQ